MIDSDVVIVGAGPAGCATALALAAHGVRATLLDRAAFPRDKPCAEYLSPEASRVLASLGALDEVEAAGPEHLAGMMVRSPAGARMVGDFHGAHPFPAFRDRGLALPRRVFDAILVDLARRAGATVEERTQVMDLLRDARGAVCGVRERSAIGAVRERRARLVVGADGLRSVVARRANLSHVAPRPRRIAMVAHYRGVRGIGEHGEMHVERDGYVGIARVASECYNVSLVVPAGRVRDARVSPDAFMTGWLQSHPRVAPCFAAAERVAAVRATGPFASQARRAWAPGVALVGDAADFFDPFTGEGIYAALRGGQMLATSTLALLEERTARAEHAVLRAYDQERRRVFGGKWKVERLVGLAVAWPALMNRVVGSLQKHKDMADLFVGVAGDFVPARVVLSPRFLAALLLPATWHHPDLHAALPHRP